MAIPPSGPSRPDPGPPQLDWGGRTARELVDHVLATHHRRSRDLLALLEPLAEECASRMATGLPQLAKIGEALRLLGQELLAHLEHEEKDLFPLLLAREAEDLTLPPVWDRETSLVQVHKEHDYAGELLDDLRILTADYQVPAGADPLVARLYEGLRELDEDHQLHIEIENRWLFSRAD
jgi:regulator of cell morphogenesis and NO signaling